MSCSVRFVLALVASARIAAVPAPAFASPEDPERAEVLATASRMSAPGVVGGEGQRVVSPAAAWLIAALDGYLRAAAEATIGPAAGEDADPAGLAAAWDAARAELFARFQDSGLAVDRVTTSVT